MAHFFFARALAVQMLNEDDEERRQPPRARLYRRRIRDIINPFDIEEAEFVNNFRLNKEACLSLINDLEEHFERGHYISRIPHHLMILSALHFMAVGSYQRSAGNCPWACLSQPMVSRALDKFCNIMIQNCIKKWIRFPRNNEERRENKQIFMRQHRMPLVIGVVDGTQIAIVTPGEDENIYVNRKGYHSINVQIISDANLKIISILARYPGSTHDSFIWRNSRVAMTMRANHENGDHNTRIMGDSGYACLPWLLTPVNNPRTASEQRFNNRFKSTRSLVERCIGVLKGRFRCLLKDRTLHYTPEKAARIVMTCAILHNIALHYRVPAPEPAWDEQDLEEPTHFADNPADDVRNRRLGQASRRAYVDAFFS